MWFNNLIIYQLNKELDLSNLEQNLAEFKAKKCPKTEFSSYGFTKALGKHKNATLVHEAAGCYLLAAQKEQRMLPSSVVKEELAEKIAEIEATQMRKVYKKERTQLQDDLIQTLLPQAFVRKSKTYAVICPRLQMIIVNSTNNNRAEELLNLLREALGSLPVQPIATKLAPATKMTKWLSEQAINDDFNLLDECQLQSTDEAASLVRCKRQDLLSDEISQHLAAGKIVTQLALGWQDKLTLVLDDRLNIKRLRFADILLDEAKKDGAEDELAELDASFTLMMLTLAEFIPALLNLFAE